MTTARTTPAKAAVPHRGRNALLTLAVPLALQAVTTVVVLSWRDDLPEQVATHWAPTGPTASPRSSAPSRRSVAPSSPSH